MAVTIKARFHKGKIEPLEKVKIAEGEEITIKILSSPSISNGDKFRKAAGAWKDTINTEELIKNIYADRLISTRPEPKL